MKYTIFLLLFILSISTSSAALIETKDSYSPGETLISKLGFLPLQPISDSQIQLLKEGHILVPTEAEVIRLGNDYFIYSSLPLNATNLTLRIKDVYRMSGGAQVFGNVEANISISGERVPYYILPGAVAAREPGIDLRIISLLDTVQSIAVIEQDNKTLTIAPGENKVRISTDNIPQGPSTLHVGDYQIPVYLDVKTSSQQNSTTQETTSLDWFPREIKGVILAEKETVYRVEIRNTGTTKINDILIEYDGSVFYIPKDHISSLDVNQTIFVDITIKKSKSSLDQVITARYGNEAFDLPVAILVTTNPSELDNRSSSSTEKYCLELNGKVCSGGEVCSSSTVKTIDQAACCLSSCVEETKNSSSWVGYLIGALVLIVLVIVGGRYLKSKKSDDSFAKRVASAEKKP